MRKFISIIVFVHLYILTVAQQMDTVYFFDYFAEHTFNKSTKRFKNSGMKIYFCEKDSILLFSDKDDVRMKLNKYKDYLLWPTYIVLEGIRVIKPSGTSFTIRVQSSKQYANKKYYLDTLFVLSKTSEISPYYWQPLREKNPNGLCDFCPDDFSLTNSDFKYKNNFKNPYILKKLMEAVKYEYYWPVGKLVRLKE